MTFIDPTRVRIGRAQIIIDANRAGPQNALEEGGAQWIL